MRTNFTQCLERGMEGEALLDRHFRQHYHIRPATKEGQKAGIDRVFIHKDRQFVLQIEYKTDDRAGETGNACLEVAKNLNPYLPGWLHTCKADFIIYYIPGQQRFLVLNPDTLRLHLGAWLIAYKLRIVKTQGIYQSYQTQCLIVPLKELEKVSARVVEL